MTYDHWKLKSDLDDWAAQNQPAPEGVGYDDEHWGALIATIIDRIGVDRFFALLGGVLDEEFDAIVTLARLRLEARRDA